MGAFTDIGYSEQLSLEGNGRNGIIEIAVKKRAKSKLHILFTTLFEKVGFRKNKLK